MSSLKINYLIPGMSNYWQCGGLKASLDFANIPLSYKTRIFTYKENVPGYNNINNHKISNDDYFVISWGPHFFELIKKLPKNRVIINSHSFSQKYKIDKYIPMICTSEYTASRWASYGVRAPLTIVPSSVQSIYQNTNSLRDIDILIFKRKSSAYVEKILLPKLSLKLKVHFVTEYVVDLASLYNRSKVLVYDSSWHFRNRTLEEGFGLHPFEARACGMEVFTTYNGSLSQLISLVGVHQLNIQSDLDLARITECVNKYSNRYFSDIEKYRQDNVKTLWNAAINKSLEFLFYSEQNQELLNAEQIELKIMERNKKYSDFFIRLKNYLKKSFLGSNQ